MTNRNARKILRRLGRKTRSFVNSYRTYGKFIVALVFVLISVTSQVQAQEKSDGAITVEAIGVIQTSIVNLDKLQPNKKVEIVKVQSRHQAEIAAKKATINTRKQKVTLPVESIQATALNVSDAEKRLWVKKAASQYNIDWRYLEAVWMVESGKRWVSPIRAKDGATGPCQFIGSTWRKYAVDGNGDGKANISEASDCLFGAARLLSANGASAGNYHKALFAYNRSMAYVAKVEKIALGLTD